METLLEAVGATVVPTAVILVGIVYPLRPQGGRLRAHPVPASAIVARLADEVDTGEIPRDLWGDTSRPATWTVPARPGREATA